MYSKGETLVIDYADDVCRDIWGLLFEIGDAVEVTLARDVTREDLHRAMGADGPWGWGRFTTAWLESIAERIEYPEARLVLYTARRSVSTPRPWPQARGTSITGSLRL